MNDAPATTAEAPAVETTAPSTPAPAPAQSIPDPPAGDHYFWGTGRRKAAVARVRIRPGEGKFLVNKRELERYFAQGKDRHAVCRPLEVTETRPTVDVFVNVVGGGTTGQAGAVVLGLARALVQANPEFGPKLKEQNLLTRDPRRVERKKYGQPGARRRFQFSKR